MADYTLDLKIDSDSLRTIKAAQLKITIAKPVNALSPDVTWLVFDPFEGNTVEWQELYGIYASPSQIIENGAVISRLSETNFPATDGAYYSFASSATFMGPFTGSGAPASGSYKVNNNMPFSEYSSLTFGLQQRASINSSSIDASPLNAAVVPAALSATFTPLTTVYVWLQGQFTSGTVITEVNGDAAVVEFGGDVTTQSLTYDPARGTFVPSSQGRLLDYSESSNVKLLKRAGVYPLKHNSVVKDAPPSGGHFIKVSVTPINGTGSLSNGNGTSLNHTFSCGTFDNDDLPEYGKLYTIMATDSTTGNSYQFGAKCVHSARTSTFEYL